ncbi:MAG: hypothetical protein AB8B56_22100 [Crocinitomicaceae bacterium]
MKKLKKTTELYSLFSKVKNIYAQEALSILKDILIPYSAITMKKTIGFKVV